MTMSIARRLNVVCAWLLCLLLGWPERSGAESPQPEFPQRAPWTTSRITGSPEPPPPYVTERAFPSLRFHQCLDLVAAPGSDRLFIVEQSGKIFSFPNQPDVKEADLAIDLAKEIAGVQQVYALAFHPRFEENRYCYVCYIKAPNLPDGTHVARFRVNDTEPPTLDPASERTILTWLSGGHNGCCLKFGPDGYLYISTGDGGPANPPDPLRAGQDLSNVLSAILRIDVEGDDFPDDDQRNYRIPADNPFVGHKGARGEIWAYGLRNPWRMSFDRQTGDLWVGDVGWELWEMLHRVERGGNYGWAVMEGSQLTHAEWPRGPTPILPPLIEHPHSESSSITEGLTYYGARLKELTGAHLYGDYDTGKVWAFRYQNGQVVDHREIADTTHRIVSFGEDHAGECYLLDHAAGTIHRLAPNPQQGQQHAFPARLSQTGLFTSVAEHTPASGVTPYSINAEPWADYAVAERFVAVPGDGQIQPHGATWTFAKDSVLAKTLSLEMEHGNPSSRRRIETQILHFDGLEWQPYTYRWNEDQTDAVLVGSAGAEAVFEVVDPHSPEGRRRQTWRYASRAECQRCHNKWSGPPLGFHASQLDKEHGYGDAVASQLDALAQMRLFAKPVLPAQRRPLADPHNKAANLDDRARAYLHVNCSHCHRMHAGGAVLSKMTYDLPLEETNMLGARPTQGTFGIHSAAVIAPGDPFRSVLWYRMAKLGNGHMPHLGSTEIDREGLELIYAWIRQLPQDTNADTSGREALTQLRQADTDRLHQLQQAKRVEEAAPRIDSLLASTSGALMLLRAVDESELPAPIAKLAVTRGAEHAEASIRDLFERFVPVEQRVKRLGNAAPVEQILAMPGDAARGKELWFSAGGLQCKNCHRIGGEGVELGPDLTQIGRKYNRAQLLESILSPSKSIDPKYVTYLVETSDGRVLTGLLVERSAQEVVLKDAQNQVLRVPAEEVELLAPQQQSLMPELLLRDLTVQQVADLLEYLGSLQ